MKFIDLTGQRYGRLVVLERVANKTYNGKNKSRTQWLCQCDCGNQVTVTGNSLRIGVTKSCGCLMHEKAVECGKKRKTHGMTHTRLYDIWRGMKKRCNDTNNAAYQNYGGRGIKICEDWNNDFVKFKDWAVQNGYADQLTIERRDVNKGYSPENCCWIPKAEQGKNKRTTNRMIDCMGNERYVIDETRNRNMPVSRIQDRLRRGWSEEIALSKPKITNEDRGRIVQQVSPDGSVINEYKSVGEAARKNGLSSSGMWKRCSKDEVYDGFIWRFKQKLKIKVKYLADIDKIKAINVGNMIDLRCAEDVTMKKGEYRLIPLGIAAELPQNYYAHIYPRSSTFVKHKIMMANSVGIIDTEYNGNSDQWYFPAYAVEDTHIEKNTRICQFRIFKNQENLEIEEVESLGNEDRGGIGSTGMK